MQSSTIGTQMEEHCSSLCERLMNFVVAFHELVQTAIPSGPSSEGLLKVNVLKNFSSRVRALFEARRLQYYIKIMAC